MATDNEKLVSYIFFTGFLSGSLFMYSGAMTFLTGLATGIVCSRAGWVQRAYERFAKVSGGDWVEFNSHLTKVFTAPAPAPAKTT